MKSKVVLISLIFVFTTVFLSSVLAHGGDRSKELQVDDIVADILERQGVDSVKDINCLAVDEIEFERLGEAAMSYMHPDDDQHKAMDEMMGGEGSESLRQAHIQMGKRFLGCEDSIDGFMGMMGPGMMMGDFWKGGFEKFGYKKEGRWNNMMPGFGMEGYGVFWVFKSAVFLTWIAFLTFLILGSVYFWKNIKKKK